jgi:hypothetical protein
LLLLLLWLLLLSFLPRRDNFWWGLQLWKLRAV